MDVPFHGMTAMSPADRTEQVVKYGNKQYNLQ